MLNIIKKLLLLLCIVITSSILLYFCRPCLNKAAPPSMYYKEKVDLFEKLPQAKYDVIFVGDSITDNAEWHEYFPDKKIINRGIQGDTVQGLNERVGNITNTKAHKVFLMIGINDLYRNREMKYILMVFEKIIYQLSINHQYVYIQSVLNVHSKDGNINKKVALLNYELEKLSYKHKNAVYIDLNQHLAPKSQLSAEYTFDGVHLNGLGYQKWKDAISKYVYH